MIYFFKNILNNFVIRIDDGDGWLRDINGVQCLKLCKANEEFFKQNYITEVYWEELHDLLK